MQALAHAGVFLLCNSFKFTNCIVHRCPKCRKYINVIDQEMCCGLVMIDVAPNKDHILKWLKQEKMKKSIKHAREQWGNSKFRNGLRSIVFERDNYKCSICGGSDELHVHHIKSLADGGNNEIDNLETLCFLCHAGEHEGDAVYNLMMGSFLYNKLYNEQGWGK